MLEHRIDARVGRPRRVEKKIRASPSPKASELAYRGQLLALVARIEEATERHLFELLERLEPQYLKDSDRSSEQEGYQQESYLRSAALPVADRFGEELAQALASLKDELAGMNEIAASMAERHIDDTNKRQRDAYFRKLKTATEVDLQGLVSEEGLEDLLEASVEHNVGLIKSIGAEHFQRIESLVYRSTIEGIVPAGGLQAKIRQLYGVSRSRAKFIARDQTAKLNADLNEARNRQLGIEEYIWKVSGGPRGDGRVRKTHLEHSEKRYRWDSPPAVTGHPGQDYQCRCVPVSVLPASEPRRRQKAA